MTHTTLVTEDFAAVQKETTQPIQQLLVEELRDIYGAEKHLMSAIPVLIRATTNKELQDVLTTHLHETRTHTDRLVTIFKMLNVEPKAKKCVGICGITDQGNNLLNATEPNTAARDAAIVFIMQRIEHYEIATYSALAQLATSLGFTDIAELLYGTLEEETITDDLLMETAYNVYAPRAAKRYC